MNKVLLITGGSRGIGAATAVLAAQHGYGVAINYRSEKSRALAVASECGNAMIVQGDVSNASDVVGMFDEVSAKLGPVTHVVNSAGVTGKASTLADAADDVIAETLNINLFGTLLVAREAVRRMSTMRGGQGGVIINISSGAATLGSPNEFIWYAASKAGVDAVTLGLGREVADQGIRICGVAPGLTMTEMHALSTGDADRIKRLAPSIPMKRAAMPDEVARTILFLLSDEASYITATTLRVAGGR